MCQSLRRSAQRKFGNPEFMQIQSGKFQTPAGVYATRRHWHTVSARAQFLAQRHKLQYIIVKTTLAIILEKFKDSFVESKTIFVWFEVQIMDK